MAKWSNVVVFAIVLFCLILVLSILLDRPVLSVRLFLQPNDMSKLQNFAAFLSVSISAVTLIVFVIGSVVALSQLFEIKKSNRAIAFVNAVQYLQHPAIREARGTLLSMGRDKEDRLSVWNSDERRAAEVVASSYDTVGTMIINEWLPPGVIVGPWNDSITKCWKRALPLAELYKKLRGDKYWEHFGRLYDLAVIDSQKDKAEKVHVLIPPSCPNRQTYPSRCRSSC